MGCNMKCEVTTRNYACKIKQIYWIQRNRVDCTLIATQEEEYRERKSLGITPNLSF